MIMGVSGSNLPADSFSFYFLFLLKNSTFGVDDRGHSLRITHTHRRPTFLTAGNYQERPHSCFNLVSNFAAKASSYFEVNLFNRSEVNCSLLDKSI